MTIFLSILTFVAGLLAVICLHELGHFFFAKQFGIYCYEYSIGFGPKIFTKKFKNHETRLSLRWIPLGGYVSMAGDEDDEEDKQQTKGNIQLNDEPNIPKNRTLTGVSKPKQILIMFGGVLVNFILAFFIFFTRNITSTFTNQNTNYFTIVENSSAYDAGLRTGDRILKITNVEFDDPTNPEYSNIYDSLPDELKQTYFIKSVTTIDSVGTPTIIQTEDAVYDFRPTSLEATFTKTLLVERVVLDTNNEVSTVQFEQDITVKVLKDGAVETVDNTNYYTFDIFGFQSPSYKLSFGEAIVQSFVDFGMSIYNVLMAIGSLFTPGGIQNVGGIVSIFMVNQQAVSMGFGTVLYIWGLISANLGVLNLIPFPGLDGWQITLTAFEGITKKKISNKFKQIASYVGVSLLLLLSVCLIFLDIFRLF